jgi:hypothetical protein
MLRGSLCGTTLSEALLLAQGVPHPFNIAGFDTGDLKAAKALLEELK